MLYIGIDLGTSACKLLLVAEDGSILNTVTKEYPLSFPHPGWSEQRPEDWWQAICRSTRLLLDKVKEQNIVLLSSHIPF